MLTNVTPARAFLLALLALAVFAPASEAGLTGSPKEVATGLETPWEVVLMPDGRVLVTERPGRVRVIEPGGALRAAPAYADPSAKKFLGMALHPNYATNRFVYLYVSYGTAANDNANRVIRLFDDGTVLTSPTTVFQGPIKSDGNHDGGRIAFGPDGKLYVTTGDVHDPALPQNLDSLNGKILRLEAPGGPGDGAAPADNPFNAAGEMRPRRFVWSYGHRHPQGIDWDASGRMWETEHGPSGEPYSGQTPRSGGHDEINRIEKGANYGWPAIIGDQRAPGMRTPVAHSGPVPAWAPGGLAFGPDGRLYAPLLAGQRLLDFGVLCDSVTDRRELYGGSTGFGRMRAATAGAGHLWLTTHNGGSDGDKVLRVPFDGAAPPPASACSGPAVEPAPGESGAPGGSEAPDRTPPPQVLRDGVNPLALMLSRAAARLRELGPGGLRRRGRIVLKGRGIRAGSLTVRLERRRRGKRPLLLARTRRAVRGGQTTRVALRLGRRGRRALRGSKAARLTLRVTMRRPGTKPTRLAVRLLVRARPR